MRELVIEPLTCFVSPVTINELTSPPLVSFAIHSSQWFLHQGGLSVDRGPFGTPSVIRLRVRLFEFARYSLEHPVEYGEEEAM